MEGSCAWFWSLIPDNLCGVTHARSTTSSLLRRTWLTARGGGIGAHERASARRRTGSSLAAPGRDRCGRCAPGRGPRRGRGRGFGIARRQAGGCHPLPRGSSKRRGRRVQRRLLPGSDRGSRSTATRSPLAFTGAVRRSASMPTAPLPARRRCGRRGPRAAVGVPIAVGGQIWGLGCATSDEPLPAGAERHLSLFSEIAAASAASMSRTLARNHVSRLAEEAGSVAARRRARGPGALVKPSSSMPLRSRPRA